MIQLRKESTMQATENNGITLFIDFRVAVESIDTFIQLLTDVIQKASQEPEFLSSDVLSDPQQPGRIILVENWAESEVWMNEVFQVSASMIKLTAGD